MNEPITSSIPMPLLDSLHLDDAALESGVSFATITAFVAASGIDWKDVHAIVISARTLKHRRARHESLSLDESDRLARLVRVFDQAVAVLGDAARARTWLSTPKHRFASRTPLALLRTEIGGRLVEEMLGQVEEGMFT